MLLEDQELRPQVCSASALAWRATQVLHLTHTCLGPGLGLAAACVCHLCDRPLVQYGVTTHRALGTQNSDCMTADMSSLG